MDEQPKVGPTGLGKLVLFLFVLACLGGAAPSAAFSAGTSIP